MGAEPPIVVFADVDSLVVSEELTASGAQSTLRMVAASRMPLVLCSTRTRGELEVFQQDLGFRHPFVCENGAAVFVPRGYFGFDVPHARTTSEYEVIEFGRPYADVVAALHRAAGQFGIKVVGFHDMSIADVAHGSGVPMLHARLAKLRQYGEPFRIAGADASARPQLFKTLWRQGLGCTTGGRYDYVGASLDEGVGIGRLCRLYRRALGPILTTGFGDPGRDAALLAQVDIPVAIPRADTPATVPEIMKLRSPRLGLNPHVDNWTGGLRWLGRVIRPRARPTRDARPGWG